MSQTTAGHADAINFLFDRPTEPVFNSKGGDGTFQFIIPDSYYTDPYKEAQTSIETRFSSASTTYRVKDLKTLPDISLPASIPRKQNFSVFNSYHQQCATVIINILIDAKTIEDFVSLATYIHDRVNTYLYIYALSVALLHRKDTATVQVPSHLSMFPELYLDKAIFSLAREEENIVPVGSRNVIDVPPDFTASHLDLEHRVAYWREDVGVNLHHWHWHLVYPLDGRREIVNKDRRGELFYYMHEQIIARYNIERLCNRLPRVRRLVDLREPVVEGYYPKLDNSVANRMWPSRHPNSSLRNVYRESDRMQIDIQDLERARERLLEAIDSGRYFLPNNNTPQQFTVETGIDILGNLVESSILSVNRAQYGNLHNDGHNIISFMHDPDNRHQELNAIMGDTAINMRDPIFYRWHAYINYLFERYKHTLPPYEEKQLVFENVQVTKIQIKTDRLPENEVATFWQNAEIDLSRGLDFADAKGSVFARVTHLQHAPFQYNITVDNKGSARMATVRIFYAPKWDERNRPFLFRDQKSLFIELDRFTHNLRSGTNTIVRNSTDSSVTLPYELTFRSLANKPAAGSRNEEAYNFCGCGWPQHMLMAKGNSSGYECQLFVMVSNYQNDQVQGANFSKTCDDASSYCGLKDSKYPDKQAMGFPFDRLPRANVQTTQQFLTPNMKLQDIVIRFTERTVAPIQPKPAPTTTTKRP